MAFAAWSDTQYGESSSPWGPRFQAINALQISTTAFDLVTAIAGTTEQESPPIPYQKVELLDVTMYYTAPSGAVTTPGQVSLWVYPSGSSTPVRLPVTTSTNTIAAAASQTIYTAVSYTFQYTNTTSPLSPGIATGGANLFPQLNLGDRIRVLSEVQGVGGTQQVFFTVRFRERPQVANPTATYTTGTSSFVTP